jgi:hypothetical protein
MQDIEPTANSQRLRVDHRRGRPMSESGQERRFGAVCNISALPLRADVGADIVEPPLSAIS